MEEDRWWEHDPEGLQEKLELLTKHFKTPAQIEKMYSHGKVRKLEVNEVKKVESPQIRMEL